MTKAIKQPGIPYSSLKILAHSPKYSSHPLLHLERNKNFTKDIIYKRERIKILLSNSSLYGSKLSHIFIQ
jgi:hypothetical protein